MTGINQVVLPLNLGYKIPEDDPVILLSEICEELDYTAIYKKYFRKWRKHSPKTLFKILVYGYMRKLFSSRLIEDACRRDICFMWLLNGEPVPDHSTLSRFMDDKLSTEIEALFYQLIEKLHELGEIKFENLFVDGTKIEANANRYTFVNLRLKRKNNISTKDSKKINIWGLFPWFIVGFIGMAVINSLALTFKNPQNLRKTIMITCPMVLIYDVLSHSYGGIIYESISIVSGIIGIIRYRKTQKQTSLNG